MTEPKETIELLELDAARHRLAAENHKLAREVTMLKEELRLARVAPPKLRDHRVLAHALFKGLCITLLAFGVGTGGTLAMIFIGDTFGKFYAFFGFMFLVSWGILTYWEYDDTKD